MNAIEMLKEDHRIVDALFKRVEDTPPSEHVALFKRIKGELETHAHAEEKVFYPALKKEGGKELKDIVLEGFEEHNHMKMELAAISRLTPKSERFEPKLKVMIEITRHHVKEEENEMFQMAEDQLTAEKLEKLGAKMQAEKNKFMKANRIKPEPRPAPTAVGAIVERAKAFVASAFTSGDTSEENGGGSRGRSAVKGEGSNTRQPAKTGSGKSAPSTKKDSADKAKKNSGKARSASSGR